MLFRSVLQSDNYDWYPGIDGAGNITITYGSKRITGIGTTFLADLAVGSNIFIADGRFVGTIANISSDTSANVVNAITFEKSALPSQARTWTTGTAYTVGEIIVYSNIFYTVSNTFVSGSAFDGQNLTIAPTVSNVAYQISSNVTVNKLDGNVYTFVSGTKYIRSNVWYSETTTLIGTESSEVFSTESNVALVPDGDFGLLSANALFNSNTIQVEFLKQGLLG